MANKNLKGITYTVGGDTTGLNEALKGVNTRARDLNTELSQVNRLMKLDPSNTVLLQQKQELLNKSISETKDKLSTLKNAQAQVDEQFQKGQIGEQQYRAFQREIESTEEKLKSLDKQAGNMSGFNQMADKLGVNANNVKTAVGTIGIAVGGFLTSSIKDASEAGNVQANLEQTVKSTGEAAGLTAQQMEDLAQKEMGLSTYSKNDIESGEAMLATFTNIGKNVFPMATQAMLDFATKMESDPKTAALTLGKALNDPATGLTKLSKAGVTFTAQQQEQIKAMEKAGNTAGAQKLMIAELNREFGGQASAAASTYSGKQKQLANDIKEVKESVGNALIPVLVKLGGYLVQILQPITNFISKNPQLSAGILTTIAVVGTLIGGMSALNTVLSAVNITMDMGLLPTIGIVVAAIAGVAVAAALIIKNWGPISSFFKNLWSGILGAFNKAKTGIIGGWNGLVAIFKAVPTWWNGLWTSVGQFFTNIWNKIGIFFTQTIPQWINNIIQWFQKLPYNIGYVLGMMLSAIINFGVSALHWVTNDLPNIINGITNWFAQLPGTIWNRLMETITRIQQWGTDTWNYVSQQIPKIINDIGTWFGQLPGKVWNWLISTLDKVKVWCNNLVSTAGTEIPKFVGKVVDLIKELPQKMLDVGKNIVFGIWNGITGAGNWLKDKIGGFCNGIVSGFKDAFGIHSPSKVFADEVGKFMALGIGQGFTDNMKTVASMMQTAIPTDFDLDIGTSINGINGLKTFASNYSQFNNQNINPSVDVKINMGDIKIQGNADKNTIKKLEQISKEQAEQLEKRIVCKVFDAMNSMNRRAGSNYGAY